MPARGNAPDALIPILQNKKGTLRWETATRCSEKQRLPYDVVVPSFFTNDTKSINVTLTGAVLTDIKGFCNLDKALGRLA